MSTVRVRMHSKVGPSSLTREDPPKGLYKLKCVKFDVKENSNKTGDNIILDLAIQAPKEVAGERVVGRKLPSFYMPVPNGGDNDEFFEEKLKRALIAFGTPAEKLAKADGEVKLGASNFVGKSCFGHFTPRDASDKDSFGQTDLLIDDEAKRVKSGDLVLSGPKKSTKKSPSSDGGSDLDMGNSDDDFDFDLDMDNGAGTSAASSGGSEGVDELLL